MLFLLSICKSVTTGALPLGAYLGALSLDVLMLCIGAALAGKTRPLRYVILLIALLGIAVLAYDLYQQGTFPLWLQWVLFLFMLPDFAKGWLHWWRR